MPVFLLSCDEKTTQLSKRSTKHNILPERSQVGQKPSYLQDHHHQEEPDPYNHEGRPTADLLLHPGRWLTREGEIPPDSTAVEEPEGEEKCYEAVDRQTERQAPQSARYPRAEVPQAEHK